jgi:hypothetical protein
VNLMMSSCRSCTETNHLVFLLFSFLTGCWSFCSLSLSLSFKIGCFGVKIFNEGDPERKIEALWCWMLNFFSSIDF